MVNYAVVPKNPLLLNCPRGVRVQTQVRMVIGEKRRIFKTIPGAKMPAVASTMNKH